MDVLVDSIRPLMTMFRNQEDLELEGSIGVHSNGSFTPGVDFQHFKNLFDEFQKAQSIWSQTVDNSHFATFYFPNDMRGRYNVINKPNFVKKTCVAKMDFKCPQRKFGIRIRLNREEPCEPPVQLNHPLCVRLHERWSFTYKQQWLYDFSKVAQGATKASACGSPVTFDIELEVVRATLPKDTSDTHLVNSLLVKLIDLLGRYNQDRKEEQLTLEAIQNAA